MKEKPAVMMVDIDDDAEANEAENQQPANPDLVQVMDQNNRNADRLAAVLAATFAHREVLPFDADKDDHDIWFRTFENQSVLAGETTTPPDAPAALGPNATAAERERFNQATAAHEAGVGYKLQYLERYLGPRTLRWYIYKKAITPTADWTYPFVKEALKKDLPVIKSGTRKTLNYKIGDDIIEFFYKRLADLKEKKPLITDIEIMRNIREAIPFEIRKHVVPVATLDMFQEMLRQGYDIYLEKMTNKAMSAEIADQQEEDEEGPVRPTPSAPPAPATSATVTPQVINHPQYPKHPPVADDSVMLVEANNFNGRIRFQPRGQYNNYRPNNCGGNRSSYRGRGGYGQRPQSGRPSWNLQRSNSSGNYNRNQGQSTSSYNNLNQSNNANPNKSSAAGKKCNRCHKMNHLAKDCWADFKTIQAERAKNDQRNK